MSVLKQCAVGAILLCLVFSVASIWKIQHLRTFSVATTIDTKSPVEDSDADLSYFHKGENPTIAYIQQNYPDVAPIEPIPTTPPSPLPRGFPSSTPAPYVKYINQSLHGTRKRTLHAHLDTTVNTPLEISLPELLGDYFQNVTLVWFKSSTKATLSISSDFYLTYTPQDWFVGMDLLKYGITYNTSNHGTETKTQKISLGSKSIRIRTGVVLNKPLLQPPRGYQFAENSGALSSWIKAAFSQMQEGNLVPDKDTWLNRRYNTCAVVGNGGSLRGSKRGQEIDSHDIVVRLNLSPLKGYEADIGYNTTLSVSNGPSSTSCWKRSTTELGTFGMEILAQATWHNQWRKLQSCQESNPVIKYLPMNYLFVDLVDNILNEYNRVMFNGTVKKYRSTGMMAVTAMTMICDHVSVYGFERGPNMENNYYDTKYDREWSGHSYEAEKAFYSDLANRTGLFEPFLELYDLYTSFSYIVD